MKSDEECKNKSHEKVEETINLMRTRNKDCDDLIEYGINIGWIEALNWVIKKD